MELRLELHKKMIWIWLGLMAFGLVGYLVQPNADLPQNSKAVAVLTPTDGHQVHGQVQFENDSQGVKIVANLTGLQPGAHGFHIHQFGDCSAPDGTSAGGHFNPHDKSHGSPEEIDRHAGDLGNIVALDNGHASYERIDQGLTLSGPDSIIGRALIVHAGDDDFKKQPTGGAGGRVACGVINPAG